MYRHRPPSSKQADLERNILSALESVPLDSMRRYVIVSQCHFKVHTIHRFSLRACCFIDAYENGLNGKQAASVWALKKYRGHRVFPESILRDFDTAHM